MSFVEKLLVLDVNVYVCVQVAVLAAAAVYALFTYRTRRSP